MSQKEVLQAGGVAVMAENTLCPYCGSGTIKHGQKNNAQRYQCKACEKTFSVSIIAKKRKYTMPTLPPDAPDEIHLTAAMIGQVIHDLRSSAGITVNMLGLESGYTRQGIVSVEQKDSGNWHTICSLLGAMGYEVVARRRE